jgi:RNase P/RNase MRP subunit p30
MIDIVFPQNNEKEFISIAEKLGINNLCFVYEKTADISEFQHQTKIKLSSAVLCKPEEVRKYKGKTLTLVKAPEDQSKLRHIIEKTRPDILFNLEFHKKRDFLHHRASGLNHILADIAKQKNVAIGFNFSVILKAKPHERAIYIGRLMQNIRFARKFKFTTVIASFAEDTWHLRSEHELVSFFMSLGMTAIEAKKSLNLINPK